MRVTDSVEFINAGIAFFPGWKISAEDYTARHENAVKVTVHYVTEDYSKRHAPEYAELAQNGDVSAQFIVDASECDDVVSLYRHVLNGLLKIVKHEAREAFRIAPTWWGPFNPHMSDGQRNWGDRDGDWSFGIV